MKKRKTLAVTSVVLMVMTLILIILNFYLSSGNYFVQVIIIAAPLLLLASYVISFVILFKEKGWPAIVSKVILMIPLVFIVVISVGYLITGRPSVSSLLPIFLFFASILLGFLLIIFDRDSPTLVKALSIILGLIIYGATLVGSVLFLALSHWSATYGTPTHRPKVK